MKLEARRVAAFLRDPGAARVVLLHGDDQGLVADRAGQLVRSVAGAVDDPFRVVELGRENWPRIEDELASLPLSGGRRVIRLRDATDAVAVAVETALAGSGPGLLVIEAGSLPPRSKLRALLERSEAAAVLACYALDAAALRQEVRAGLEAQGVGIDPAALAWVADRLAGSLSAAQAEADKLSLYVGGRGTVDLAVARACVGDLAVVSSEDAVDAALAGSLADADRALDRALAEGAAAVAVLRQALAHVQRLQIAASGVAAGTPVQAAIRALRPPLFYRREAAFARALALWPGRRLAALAQALAEAERACKRTGAPAEAICRNLLHQAALHAAQIRGRGLAGQG